MEKSDRVKNKKAIIYRVASLLLFLIIFYIAIQYTDSDDTYSKADSDVYYLPVIETTDIHGYIIDISSNDEATYKYRLGYIANIINEEKSKGDILLLDTGDFYQGNILSNNLDGQPIRAYIDEMEYDAVGLRNHEFDWGLDKVLDHDGTVGSYDLSANIKADSKVPVLCWNIYDSESKEKVDYTKDYIIVNKEAKSKNGQTKNINIAVFGYVNDYSSSIAKDKIKGYEIIEDDFDDIEEKAKELENSKKVDVSVVVCHASPDDMKAFIKDDTVIDLVLCGHDHKASKGTFTNGVPYLDGGAYGESYAKADIVITDDNHVTVENTQIAYINDNEQNLYDNAQNDAYLDDAVMELSHSSLDLVNEKCPDFSTKLGYIVTDISRDKLEGSLGEDIASTWAAKMYADAMGAQVGIINSTGVRCGFLMGDNEEKHYLTGADIYTMFPFKNRLLVYEISYEQLLDLCSRVALNDHSYLGMSGVDIVYEDEDRKKPVVLYLDGELIYDNEWKVDKTTKVKVAVADFIAAFDNLCFKNLTPINASENVVDSKAVIEYLKNNYGPDKEIEVDTKMHLKKLP